MSRQEFKQLELTQEDIFKIIINTPKLIKYISQVENPDFTSIIKNIKAKFEKKQKRIRQMEEDKDRKKQSDLEEKLQQIRQKRLQFLEQSELEEQQLVEQLSELKLNEEKENSSKRNGNTEEEEVEEKKQNSFSEDSARTNVFSNEQSTLAYNQMDYGASPQNNFVQEFEGQSTSCTEGLSTSCTEGLSTSCTEGSNQHNSFESISQGTVLHPPNFGDVRSIQSNNSSNSSTNQTIGQINNNIN